MLLPAVALSTARLMAAHFMSGFAAVRRSAGARSARLPGWAQLDQKGLLRSRPMGARPPGESGPKTLWPALMDCGLPL
ncbi:hypothetical protein GCM10011574_60040 [Microbispora bryophytorum]|uniref:Uncharacterized protein n=1 Tax=Microbispora bryophytorum TaxID=1460882 RepID=A0A8H9H733_9ACTN|nr:hypothetical protein GCM10011574_60040 [Microbispora bryophytorum]